MSDINKGANNNDIESIRYFMSSQLAAAAFKLLLKVGEGCLCGFINILHVKNRFRE